MHRCTIDGCSMMFSSRRSRNRHSANPNAKLHVDLQRRGSAVKISTAFHQLDYGAPVMMHEPSAQVKGVRFLGGLASAADRSHDRVHPGDVIKPWYHDVESVAPTADVSSSTHRLCQEQHAVDSFRQLTKLAEMAMREDEGVVSHNLTATSSVPSLQPAARKRKNILPTRCERQEAEAGDWSEDSSDEFSAFTQDQQRRQHLQTDSDGKKMRSAVEVSETVEHVGERSVVAESNDVRSNWYRPRTLPVNVLLRPARNSANSMHVSPTEHCSASMHQGLQNASSDAEMTHAQTDPDSNSLKGQKHIDGIQLQLQELNYGDQSHRTRLWRVDGTTSNSESPGADNETQSSDGQTLENEYEDDEDEYGSDIHPCKVLGCNATFRSKRSRDRHSANVQLHQKLLSTVATCVAERRSADTAVSCLDNRCTAAEHGIASGMTSVSAAASFRDELCVKSAAAYFYYMQLHYGLTSWNELQPGVQTRTTPENIDQCGVATAEEESSPSDLVRRCLDRRLAIEPSSVDGSRTIGTVTSSSSSSPDGTEVLSLAANPAVGRNELAPLPAPDGTAVCHVCTQTFQDNLVLKEHIEKLHPREMYRCTVPGCDKIFSTRKSRNRHSQNDNLHYVFPFAASLTSPQH